MAERGLLIGERLRTLRNERALTQRDLADLSNVHVVTISELEGSKRRASAQTTRKLARGLGIEVRELTVDDRTVTEEQRAEAEEYKEMKRRQRTGEHVEGEPGDRQL